MNPSQMLQDLLKKVGDLSTDVAKLKEGAASKEVVEKRLQDLVAEREQALRTSMVSELRKGRFDADDDEKNDKAPHELIIGKARDEKHREFQKWNDKVLLASRLLKTHPTRLNIWQREASRGGVSELKKAMDTATAAEGLEWIPTDFSADLIDRVRLAYKVVGLHKHINMPTNPFKLPVVSSDASAYLIGESTADGTDTKIAASTPGTSNVTLTAKKLAARVIYSEEMTEDSIIATSDFVLDNMAVSIAQSIEDAIINGDTAGTHMDNDVTSSTDHRKAFDGYRKKAQDSNQVSLATFSTANLRSMRAKMGKYGVDPSKLVWLTGPKGYKHFLGLSEVITVDKYGNFATVLSGELGKFDGIPLIVSEKIRENLGTTGLKDNTTSNNTEVLLVYVPGFVVGDKRKITVKTWEDIERDQTVVVATVRHAFNSIYDASTEAIAIEGVDVDAA